MMHARYLPALRSLFSLLIFMIVLTACAQEQTSTSTTPKSSTITYWHLWTDKFYGGIQDELVNKFNQSNAGFTVKSERQGDTSKFLASVAAGSPPDVYMIPTGPIQLAVQGGLMPLDDYIKNSKIIKQEDYWPGAWSTCTFKGKVYCIPYVYATFTLFWNKDYFKEAGLDPEKPPTTWDELEGYAEKLTKYDNSGNITQLGFAPWVGVTSAAEWPMWANGGQLWDFKTGQPTADNEANVKALQWQVDWVKKFGGYDKLQRFGTSFGGNSAFFGQKVAMWIGESYFLSGIQEFQPKLNYGVAPFGVPRPDGSQPYINGIVAGNMIGIPTGSKNPDLAWKFIEKQATDGVRDWVVQVGDISARKADINLEPTSLKEPYRSDYKVFTKLLLGEHVYNNQGTPIDLYYFKERDYEFDLVRRGTKTPQQALKDLQAKLEQQLTQALSRFQG